VKPLSRRQAAIRYLAIVKPYNVALERLEGAINGGEALPVLRELAGKVAAANVVETRALGRVAWPAPVRGPIRQLRAESGRAQVYWRQAARAGSRDGLIGAVLTAARHDGSEPAATIRRLLQLDKYDERAYS
jgi:hypothetical protein